KAVPRGGRDGRAPYPPAHREGEHQAPRARSKRRRRESRRRSQVRACCQFVACHGIPLSERLHARAAPDFSRYLTSARSRCTTLASQSGGLISAITVRRQLESRKAASAGLASGASPTRRSHAKSSASVFTICGPPTWPLCQSWV